MFGFMDSTFSMRRILISNLCWIILAFHHVGVNGQPTFEISGSGMINTSVNFTCSSGSTLQEFFGQFKKGEVDIVTLPQSNTQNITYGPAFSKRVTTSVKPITPTTATYIMKLDHVQCSDEGNYTCLIQHYPTASKTVKPFLVQAKPHMPTLTAPTDYVVLGDTVTLNCTAIVGKPPRHLSLCVGRQKDLNCSESSTLVDSGNCTFTRTVSMTVNITEDTSQATCEVIVPEKNLNDFKPWEVYYPVLDIKFVPDNSVVRLDEGKSMTITCEARGKPTPSYRWDFQPSNSNGNPTPFETKNLVLERVSLAHNGIYSCVAFNTIRNITFNMTKSITVNIVPSTPAPTTTIAPTTEKIPITTWIDPAFRPQKSDDTKWKFIVGIVGAILFLAILIIVVVNL